MTMTEAPTQVRQGIVIGLNLNETPPTVDVDFPCEGTFFNVPFMGTAPALNDSVWVLETGTHRIITGIQSNNPAGPDNTPVTDNIFPPAPGNNYRGPTIYEPDLRRGIFRDGIVEDTTINGSELNNPVLNSPVINGAIFSGGVFEGAPTIDSPNILTPVLTTPVINTPTIDSPSFGGGGEVTETGAIRSNNYDPGLAGWAIGGNGTAEFNQLLVRSSAMVGGLVVGIQDLDGTMSGGAMSSANYSAGSAGWAIDGAGNAEFNNVTVRGSVAAGGALASLNYAVGLTGWTINGDGSAEFNDIDIRGTLRSLGTGGAFIDVGGFASAQMTLATGSADEENPAFILAQTDDLDFDALTLAGPKQFGNLAPTMSLISFDAANLTAVQFQDIDYVSMFTARLEIPNGSVGDPAIRFQGDTDTGIYSPSSNNLLLVAAGAQRARFSDIGVTFYNRFFATNLATSGTTSGEPLWHYNAGGDEIYRYTSSGRLKRYIREWSSSAAEQVLALQPRMFDPLIEQSDGVIRPVQDPKLDRRPETRGQMFDVVGLIAEEVATAFPQACIYGEDGNPANVDWSAITTSLIALVQRQAAQLANLDDRLTTAETDLRVARLPRPT